MSILWEQFLDSYIFTKLSYPVHIYLFPEQNIVGHFGKNFHEVKRTIKQWSNEYCLPITLKQQIQNLK